MPWFKTWSLRGRVYSVGAGAILVAWMCGGVAIYSSAQREYERMCHENLANLAETVLSFAEHELGEVAADAQEIGGVVPVHSETAATLGQRYSYQIWSRDGKLLLRSVHAPDAEPLGPFGVSGLTETVVKGIKRDVFVRVSPAQGMEIHVSDSSQDTMHVSDEFLSNLAVAFVLSMLPVLLGTWLLMRGAFDSLLTVAQHLRQRVPTDVRPLPVVTAPPEVTPLIDAINGSLTTAGEALERERNFTALAAHELRTPLSALRVQAQVLARADSESARHQGSQALLVSVDRCARLVTQLLELVRADSKASIGSDGDWVQFDQTCADVLVDFVDEAAKRNIELTCALGAQEVVADPVALQTLLRNLVSNAMKHTPNAGAISICTQHEQGEVVLRVDDSGHGIPEAERDSVFHRFYRGLGASGLGVGLGLAIVSSIAQAHHAVVKLGQAPLGGLRVEVRFRGAR